MITVGDNLSKREATMIYKTLSDIPVNGRPLIKRLIDQGIIEIIDGEINLDEIIYKMLIILSRLGLV